MRVFLSGAQGVGKSTIINSLESSLSKRDSYSKRFLLKDKNSQLKNSPNNKSFQDRILLHCLSIYVNEDNFISSRSIIDSYAYTEINQPKEPFYRNMMDYYSEYLFTETDIYCYIPIEFELSLSGNSLRSDDREYQLLVDSKIREIFDILKNSKKSTFLILEGSLESRVNKLLKNIRYVSDKS
jgi:thymidylate kinase